MKMTVKGDIRHGHRGVRGFTLVEMLLVLLILALLAAIVYPSISNRTLTARIQTAQTQIGAMKQALQLFEVDTGHFPTGTTGLQELVQSPRAPAGWHGPYLERIPKDPWGNDYVYICPGNHFPASFDLLSWGPDGIAGTGDDITNWQEPKRQ